MACGGLLTMQGIASIEIAAVGDAIEFVRTASDSGRARRTSMRVLSAELALSSRGVPRAMTLP